jgi:hypothetical protein
MSSAPASSTRRSVTGGDFRFAFNVLPRELTRDGAVLADDYGSVSKRFFTQLPAPATAVASAAPLPPGTDRPARRGALSRSSEALLT